MIFSLASATILTLGVYAAWRADRCSRPTDTAAVTGQYLGGLLIIVGLALIGIQFARAFVWTTLVPT